MRTSLAALCIISLVVGTAFANGTAEKSKSGSAPQLIVQLMANPPADGKMVTDAINQILVKRLDVTVKFQHFTWTNWQQNYRLMLASSAPVDILYAAWWAFYAAYAHSGAYRDIGPLLPKVVPALYKTIPQKRWNGVKVGGKIYAVPSIKKSFGGAFSMVYRKDLAEKYGAPPVTDLKTMEQYFRTIKKNVPGMYPVESPGLSWMQTLFTYMVAKAHPNDAWESGIFPKSQLLFFDYRHPNAKMRAPWEFKEYMPFLELMHKFAQEGFWSRDILAQKNIPAELVQAGKSAAAIGGGENIDKVQGLIQDAAKNNPSWKIGVYNWGLAQGFALPAPAQQDLSTIPIQSKHPEKALQVIQAFMLDKDLQYLVDYGIKGVTYTINSKNQYVQLPGAKGYGIYGMQAWAWENQNLLLGDGSVWGDQRANYIKKFEKIAVPNSGFRFNPDPVNSQVTAVRQVEQQYGWPLWSGLVNDIPKAEKEFQQKLQQAGFDQVRAAMAKQFAAYEKSVGK